jgi:hypothetical protein
MASKVGFAPAFTTGAVSSASGECAMCAEMPNSSPTKSTCSFLAAVKMNFCFCVSRTRSSTRIAMPPSWRPRNCPEIFSNPCLHTLLGQITDHENMSSSSCAMITS